MQKKIVILLMVCALATVSFVNVVQAAPAWWTVQVVRIGPTTGASYVQLKEKNGKFTGWWKLPTAKEKEFLAVLLTALANNKEVTAYIDPAKQYVALTNCYIWQ